MKTLFLVLFAAVSILHLAASFVSNKKLRAATKGFILLFLLLYYLFAAEKRNGVLIAAVATSWLGDVLLIPPGNGWFAAGGISFMLSHFCFIAVYIMAVNFADVNVILTVLEFASFNHKFTGIAKYPAVTRDLSMVVPKNVLAGDIEAVIAQRGGKILESYQLFDIYEGSQIKSGYKSMAYSVVFRAHDKTLEESEITAAMKKILNGLSGLGIELRS